MRWIAGEEYLGLFFEITDDQLKRISKDNTFWNDADFIKELEGARGCNAFFFKMINNGNIKRVYEYLYELSNQYKTVSWWSKDNKTFHIRRTKCQH